MTKPQGSVTFIENDNDFLWLAMMCRDTGRIASEVMQIKDEVLAMDFDLAVTLRLFAFENEKDQANKEFWVQLVTGEESN